MNPEDMTEEQIAAEIEGIESRRIAFWSDHQRDQWLQRLKIRAKVLRQGASSGDRKIPVETRP